MAIFCSAKELESLCLSVKDRADVVRIQAKGGSMYPYLRSGDWVDLMLCKDNKKDFKKGDVILFRKGDSLCLHRVLRKTAGGVLAKGDMSFGYDGVIPRGDILAKVVSVRRGCRRIDLSSPASRFAAVLAAETSVFLQYPFLFIRKFSACGMFVLSRIQALKVYRRTMRRLLDAAAVVRVAGPQDQEQLSDLYRMAGCDIKDGIAAAGREGFWLVAELGRKVAGGLTITRHGKDAALWVIFGLEVKPLLRGLGIGRAIVREAVAQARLSGAKKIGLFVNKNALPALCLYRSLGFLDGETPPQEFNRSCDEFYLSYMIDG